MTTAHVLVVDDEELNLEILLEYFDGEPGFTLETAADGEIAWDLLQDPTKSFDLILLDRMMPRLDGVGLLRRIKAEPLRRHPGRFTNRRRLSRSNPRRHGGWRVLLPDQALPA